MMRPINQSQSNAHCNCREEMNQIRAIDFAIQETVLYLDAYPKNAQALAYYHQLVEKRGELMRAYEAKCGPISMYGNTSRTSWDWVEGPWPWEPEAN